MDEYEKRTALFNEIMRVVKDSNVEIGTARAVLGEIESVIMMASGYINIRDICARLKEKSPRK